jgi:hypothetical protein
MPFDRTTPGRVTLARSSSGRVARQAKERTNEEPEGTDESEHVASMSDERQDAADYEAEVADGARPVRATSRARCLPCAFRVNAVATRGPVSEPDLAVATCHGAHPARPCGSLRRRAPEFGRLRATHRSNHRPEAPLIRMESSVVGFRRVGTPTPTAAGPHPGETIRLQKNNEALRSRRDLEP